MSGEEMLRRLGNRWVFDCANRLIMDEGLERKHAFAQAAKAYHLLEQLGKGEVRFEYLKTNGELRKRTGSCDRRAARCVTASARRSTTMRIRTGLTWGKGTSASSCISTLIKRSSGAYT